MLYIFIKYMLIMSYKFYYGFYHVNDDYASYVYHVHGDYAIHILPCACCLCYIIFIISMMIMSY